ncbi:hypothetical protein OOT00_09110 [Desulfobotulus sp. H1]|nr:hypothetical protein [Desulfobotulus pelophilus]
MKNNVLWIVCIGIIGMAGCTDRNHRMKEENMQRKPSPDVSAISVFDLNGKAVALDSLWQDRKVVLVFLRHYG